MHSHLSLTRVANYSAASNGTSNPPQVDWNGGWYHTCDQGIRQSSRALATSIIPTAANCKATHMPQHKPAMSLQLCSMTSGGALAARIMRPKSPKNACIRTWLHLRLRGRIRPWLYLRLRGSTALGSRCDLRDLVRATWGDTFDGIHSMRSKSIQFKEHDHWIMMYLYGYPYHRCPNR